MTVLGRDLAEMNSERENPIYRHEVVDIGKVLNWKFAYGNLHERAQHSPSWLRTHTGRQAVWLLQRASLLLTTCDVTHAGVGEAAMLTDNRQ